MSGFDQTRFGRWSFMPSLASSAQERLDLSDLYVFLFKWGGCFKHLVLDLVLMASHIDSSLVANFRDSFSAGGLCCLLPVLRGHGRSDSTSSALSP